MKTLLAAVALFGLAQIDAQARDLEMIEGAYEVSLGETNMPGSIAGTATFRTCATCDTIGMRVNGNTVFQVGGAPMALPDFLIAVDDIRDSAGGNASTLVAIYYALDSNTITRINVLPAAG